MRTGSGAPELPPRERLLVERGRRAEAAASREEARAWYEAALRSLPATGHACSASAILRWIARTHDADGEPVRALDVSEAAVAVAEAAGDDFTLASALNSRAAILFNLGELDASEALLRKARGLARMADADELVAMVEQNLANIASIRGDIHLALVQYHASLAGYRRLGLTAYEGPLLNNIGRLHTDLGDRDAAERSFDEAAERCRTEGDRSSEVVVEVNRTRLYLELRDYPRAEEVCMRTLELALAADAERSIAEVWRNFGVIRRELGQLDDAALYLERARSLSEVRRDTVLTADVAREQATLFRTMGRNVETLRALNDAHRLFEQLRARHELSDVDERLRELEEAFLAVVREWSLSIEQKDTYTHGHCERVSEYACRLAVLAGMADSELKWFRMGAILHDVGKVSVSLDILNKPGPLTDEERAVMAKHPENGVALLQKTEFPWDVRPMIRHHHERWDGRGYPDGLSGAAIPLAARILTVADVWDALTTTRSYREAFTPSQAWTIMESEVGRTLDPELVPLFHTIVAPELEADGRYAESGRPSVRGRVPRDAPASAPSAIPFSSTREARRIRVSA